MQVLVRQSADVTARVDPDHDSLIDTVSVDVPCLFPLESSSTLESQCENHGQNARCGCPRPLHTAFLTVILSLSLKSGFAQGGGGLPGGVYFLFFHPVDPVSPRVHRSLRVRDFNGYLRSC